MKMRSDLKNPRKLKVKVSPYLFNSDNRNPTQNPAFASSKLETQVWAKRAGFD